jgi:hypothetical protein
MVNSVLSSLPTFFMCSMKAPIEILDQIDKYQKNTVYGGVVRLKGKSLPYLLGI